MLMSKIPLTVSGAERLRSELQRLKTVDRPAAIAAIGEARLHGDISENAEYDAAKDRQGFIEGRIARIEDTLDGTVSIADHSEEDLVAVHAHAYGIEPAAESDESLWSRSRDFDWGD